MAHLLIVHHSRTGGTAQMAAAAHAGACGEAADARMLECGIAAPADLLDAGGYIFAMPENLASMSGAMKEFFDRCYYELLDRLNGRPYALMVCAGSDGHGAVRQAARIATGWRLRQVAEPVIVRTGAQTAEAILAPKAIAAPDLARCRELGAALAAGLAMGAL